jgi:hypothetical protein
MMKRIVLALAIAILAFSTTVSAAEGLLAPGATEAGVRHDCQVTAELSVALLQQKAKATPPQLQEKALKLLADKGYKGSFGDAGFVAYFYTGMALQMGAEVDGIMAQATAEELESMEKEHLFTCLKQAFSELEPK